jgi:tRNA pseudouridine38-40 synthase
LRHMVRNIVGSLVDVGRGKQRPSWFQELLEVRDRVQAGRTAPGEGLYLVRVDYPAALLIPGEPAPRFAEREEEAEADE